MRADLLWFDVTVLFWLSHVFASRLAGCACVTLCHVAHRRSSASLPRYQAVPLHERIEVTRRTIIAAAVHAFRVRGYPTTTMSTVAAIARVSPRTLYRYFGSKSELFAATIAEATSDFLRKLQIEISKAPLRDAIINAFQNAEIEVDEESREMMRRASTDEQVWRYFLGATTRMQPALAATLRAATGQASDNVELLWDVRAGALFSAIAAAYRQWASVPGTDLTALVAEAVDVVMPAIACSPDKRDLGSRSTPDFGLTSK